MSDPKACGSEITTMSTVPTADDLKTLAVKLAAVTDRVASRLQQTSEQSLSASQAKARHVYDAQKVAEDITRDALDQFRQTASGAIREGLRGAAERHDQALAASAQQALAAIKWQQEIAEAQAAGKLAPCLEGGLCAMINKRWTRIDR